MKNLWLSGELVHRGTVALPLSDLRSVAIREFSRGRTALLGVTVTVAVVTALLIVRAQTHRFNCFFGCGL